MKHSKAVAKRIAELHNQDVKRSARGSAAIGEEVIRRIEDAVEDTYARTTQEGMEFNRKLLAIAHENADLYFEWVRELVRVNSPSEFITISIKHSQHQFETFHQQTRELFGLAQKAAIENMGPPGTVICSALIGRPDLS